MESAIDMFGVTGTVTQKEPAASTVSRGDLLRAAWSSSVGSALEYYDFALYSLASALIFGPLFFPNQAPGMALISSFGTYFIGFAARPLGGIFFGSLGDRLGRKFVLMATIFIMGLASTLIGVLPTYETAGIWAPIMLVILRILQGFGAGAEQAGAAVLMAEYSPKKERGFYAALPFLGIHFGSAMAAAVYFFVLNGIEDVAHTFMWRIPFLISIVIIGLAAYIRLHLKESPSFAKLEAHQQVSDKPLANLLKNSRKNVLVALGLRMAENGGSSIYMALAVSYVVNMAGLPKSTGALCLLFGVGIGLITIPIAALLSDRFGRVPVYRLFAVLQLLTAYPVWWVFSQGNLTTTLIAFMVALGVGAWGMFGTQAALLPELFGARHRYIGVAFAREVSALFAGGIAPLVGSALIAWVISMHGGVSGSGVQSWVAIATYLAILSLITIVSTFMTPETLGRDMDDLHDA